MCEEIDFDKDYTGRSDEELKIAITRDFNKFNKVKRCWCGAEGYIGCAPSDYYDHSTCPDEQLRAATRKQLMVEVRNMANKIKKETLLDAIITSYCDIVNVGEDYGEWLNKYIAYLIIQTYKLDKKLDKIRRAIKKEQKKLGVRIS